MSAAHPAHGQELLRNAVPSSSATASSQADATTAPKCAVDYSKLTSWIPAAAEGEWIQINFAREESVRRVIIDWEFSLKASWRIEISSGGTAWKEAARGVKDGNSNTVVDVNGRAERMKVICSAGVNIACSIRDLQVWVVEPNLMAPAEPARQAPTPPIEPTAIPTPVPPPKSKIENLSPTRPAVGYPGDSLRSKSKIQIPPSIIPSIPLIRPVPVSKPKPAPKAAVEVRPEPKAAHAPPVRTDLITTIDSFEKNIAAAPPLGQTPFVEVTEGSVMNASPTDESQGRGGKGRAHRATFVVTPEGKAFLGQKLGSAVPLGWTDLSFWVRGSWAAGAPLEVVLADASDKRAAVAVPGTEGGGKLWRQVKIPASAVAKIDRDRLKSYALRFTPKHRSGDVFIDDVTLNGGLPPTRTSASSKPSPASAPSSHTRESENPESESDSESKIKNLKSKISGPLPEVRLFTYDPKDRLAVHEMLLTAAKNDPKTSEDMTDDEFLDLIERRAFLFFWYGANPENGITLDGAKNWAPNDDLDWNSIAAVGFGLTAICIGAERGWIPKEMAYERCRVTLDFYLNKAEQRNGFYYHFTNRKGVNDRNTELSSVDSLLMYTGMLFVGEYFKGTEVDSMARRIYDRVDWRWMHNGGTFATMGAGGGGGGFINARWDRHCEGQLLSILELGHPQNMPTNLWFDMPEELGTYQGYRSLIQGPLFTFQFPANWIDFRDRNDGTVNFWENGIEATLANRYYAVEKMPERKGYGPNSWGFSAGDFPGGYHPFAAPPSHPGEDGTVTINAAGGSVMFTPHLSIKALRWMYDNLHDKVWGKYGFTDGYNLDKNWYCDRMIGIGTGPMMLAIENYRTGFVWDVFMKNDYVKKGMERIGFKDETRRNAKARPIDLSGEWKWKQGDNKNWSKPDADDSNWRGMYVPDKWELQLTANGDRKMAEFDGFGWYRLRFTVPFESWESWKGQDLFLHVGAIDDADEVFLNGEKIGSTGTMSAGGESAWEKPRKYAVPRKLVNVGEENVLAIRVFDSSGGGGIWMRPVELGPFLPLDFKPWRAP